MKGQRYIILYMIGVLLSYMIGVEALGQGKKEMETLEQLGLMGWSGVYSDTLAKIPLEQRQGKALGRAIAIEDLRQGRNLEANAWYSGLSSREQGLYNNLVVATLLAAHSYDFDLADRRKERLEKLRLRDAERIELREQVAEHVDLLRRLYGHTRSVVVLDQLTGRVTTMVAELQKRVNHLGEIGEQLFVTPDGGRRWEVRQGEASNTLDKGTEEQDPVSFAIRYQLADGSWAEEAIEVQVLGLPRVARVAYPFLMPDGQTLYFALEQPGMVTKGAIGGYDLYVSRYDREQQKLLVPQQLSLPFNSTSDDLLYIADEAHDLLYLLTTRGCKCGDAHLLTLRLSSVRPCDEETLSAADASLLPIVINEEARAEWLKGAADASVATMQSQKGRREPLFAFGTRLIYTAGDLTNELAKRLLGEYEALLREADGKRVELNQLRVQYNPSDPSPVLEQRVLLLEKELEELSVREAGMRNEIIKMEKRM